MDRSQLLNSARTNVADLSRGNLGVPLLLLVMLAMDADLGLANVDVLPGLTPKCTLISGAVLDSESWRFFLSCG